MARYFFYCTGGEVYTGQNVKYTGGAGLNGGYACGDQPDDGFGRFRSLVMFNSNDIRTQLTNMRVTGCYISIYVLDAYYDTFNLQMGTHNYTAIPDVWSASRVNANRFSRNEQPHGQITMWNIGTTIGTEFKDGVTTGLALGPPPNDTDNPNFFYTIAPNGDSREPVLIIDAESTNLAPNTPVLTGPPASTVIDTQNSAFTASWVHSDPNGEAQAAYRFRRVTSGGATEYWNGSSFVPAQTDVVGNASSITFPAGLWATDNRFEWTVATRDAAGLWGPYAAPRVIWSSVRPTTTVNEPVASTATPRPTVRWSYADTDGDPQYGWALQIVEPPVYSDPTWNPDNYLRQYWSTSADGTATAAAVGRDLRNHATYRAYVKTASSPNPSGGLQWSNWAFRQFQVVVPPAAPSITFPLNGSVDDLNSGFTMVWVNNHYQGIGAQTAFSIRRQVSGQTSYTYWNGSAWIAVADGGVIPVVTGNQPAYSFRAGEVANGSIYTFSVQIRDDYNQVSPWSGGTTVEASTAATVTVTNPPAVSVVSNPIVSWTMFDLENDPQQTYQVRIIAASVFDVSEQINPATATAVWDTGEVVDTDGSTRSVEVPVDLQNAGLYRAYVRVRTTGVYSGWSYSQFLVSLVPPATPDIDAVVMDDHTKITIQGRDNMLSDAISRNFSGWDAGENSTVINAVQFGSAYSGYATTIRSIAPGAMTCHTSLAWPAAAGQEYTGALSVIAKVNVTPVLAYVSIEWLDINGTLIGVSNATGQIDDSAIRSSVTATAPAGTAFARLRLSLSGVDAANADHQFFNPVLRPGTGDEWSPGGTLSKTFATLRELGKDRQVRYSTNIPLPIATQRVEVHDYEVAMSIPQTYTATTRAVYPNAALVSDAGSSDPVTWVDGYLWLSDPLRPGSGRRFSPVGFDAVTRPVRQGKFRPIGRPDAIITTGVRGLREGAFTIVCHTREEREAFQELSDRSEILLMRVPPDTADPRIADYLGETLYVRLEGDAPEERPLSSRTPHRTIKQSWTEQRSPEVGYEYVEDEG
jgi:hypothetical protein